MSSDIEFRVRESPRAKHVRLLISVRDGSLTAVIPPRFDRRQISQVLREKHQWIERTQRRILEQSKELGPDSGDGLPSQISLRAIGEEWQVEYRERSKAGDAGGSRTLVLYGAIEDQAACKETLRRWIHAQARRHLVPRLLELGQRHGISVRRVTIRAQRTRWGSCSARNCINLNEKLMFLPTHLVSQVMVHELCHIRHQDHSKEFWALVEGLSPGCRELERELRTAWRYVPAWYRA